MIDFFDIALEFLNLNAKESTMRNLIAFLSEKAL